MNIRAAENNFTNRCKVIVVDYWAEKQKNRDGRGSLANLASALNLLPIFTTVAPQLNNSFGACCLNIPNLSMSCYRKCQMSKL